jgi:hypothetical protein
LYDSIISLRGEIGAYKTSLTLPLFIEVHVPSEESERLYIYKLILESHAMLDVFDWFRKLRLFFNVWNRKIDVVLKASRAVVIR